jgi:hypothetical protein
MKKKKSQPGRFMRKLVMCENIVNNLYEGRIFRVETGTLKNCLKKFPRYFNHYA